MREKERPRAIPPRAEVEAQTTAIDAHSIPRGGVLPDLEVERRAAVDRLRAERNRLALCDELARLCGCRCWRCRPRGWAA